MHWLEVFTIIGANIALIYWFRADMKTFDSKLDKWCNDIQAEMKDFHNRLCEIEEKNKGK